tara:strand:- start:1215 stop:1502 length:288 start_codon:yes stop_codon:yes gene_type:complete
MAITKEQQEYMENLLKPGEEPGEGYEGSPDMYPDYEEDKKDLKRVKSEPKPSKTQKRDKLNKKTTKKILGVRNYKSGSYITVKTKLGRNKKTKIC